MALAMAAADEAPRRMKLTSLPGEMQNKIISQLDPVALIALSQTDRYFRQVIRPNKREMAERLLVLETQIMVRGRHDSDDAEHFARLLRPFTGWENQLWACTGCLRLLTHIHFDTRSLKKLEYRKRWMRHPERLVTSWGPSSGRDGRERTPWVGRRCHLTFEGRSMDPIYGAKRWNRQCNECRYQSNALASASPNGGEERPVPVQRSRSFQFKSHLARWFPRLGEFLDTEPWPFPHEVDRCYCGGIGVEVWTMYMVRCPRCEAWQEMREFRLSRSAWGHGGSLPADVLCNSCLAHQLGRQALVDALLPHLKRLIEEQRAAVELRLTLSTEVLGTLDRVLSAWKSPIQKPLMTCVWGVNCLRRIGVYNNLTLTALNLLHREVLELRGSVPDNERCWLTGGLEWNNEFIVWLCCFEQFEAQWRWLAAYEREIDRDPGLLADWALKRDGASFY